MTTTTPRPAQSPTPSGPRPSLARLTAVELRKTLDTRAGRWFLGAVLALAAAAAAYEVGRHHHDGALSYTTVAGTPGTVVRQLLPVLGVLATTSEWTQRTALTTFALVPQRGRVLTAKLAAALVLVLGVVLVVTGFVAALVAAVSGFDADWSGAGRVVGGAVASSVLSMLMGAGIGALLQSTSAALVAFFVLPTLVSAGAVIAFGDAGRWVDIVTPLGDASRLHLTSSPAPASTAVVLWVVLPLAAGALRTLRRQVA